MRHHGLLFVHGAGGYVEDRALAEAIGAALGAEVRMPRFADEDMSFEGWASPLRTALSELGPEDHLIAHSFGASILLSVLAEREWAVERATLLAMPDWTPDGWDVADYAFTAGTPEVDLCLHHCRDDEVVPFSHLALHTARLPAARVQAHRSGGHQFDGLAEPIAASLTARP